MTLAVSSPASPTLFFLYLLIFSDVTEVSVTASTQGRNMELLLVVLGGFKAHPIKIVDCGQC